MRTACQRRKDVHVEDLCQVFTYGRAIKISLCNNSIRQFEVTYREGDAGAAARLLFKRQMLS